MGEMPLMTGTGTFIVNGTERVIVSQLHRSPGVFFDHDKGKTHSSGKLLFSARVIPYRGSWLDFEFDPKDALFTRIDRRRKLPVTVLLRALGYNDEEILEIFFEHNVFHLNKKDGATLDLVAERLRGETLNFDLVADGERAGRGGQAHHRAPRAPAGQVRRRQPGGAGRLPDRPHPGHRRGRAEDRRADRRGQRRDHRGVAGEVPQGRHRDAADPVRERPGSRSVHLQHPARGSDQDPARGAGRDLPHDASGRAADQGSGAEPVLQPVLHLRPLRPVGGRPHEVQPPRRPQRSDRPERAVRLQVLRLAQGRGVQGAVRGAGRDVGHPRRAQGADRHQERPWPGRRHRPPGQPSRAFGRRNGREHLPHRPGARRARRARAPVAGRGRQPGSAGPDQRQAGGRGGEGVLRLLAAVAVHGPEQPAVGSHPQAPRLGAGPGRPDPRARRLRGARRASDPLRSRVHHRDPGRPEHRPDQLAGRVRPHQPVRLPGDAVPQGRERQGHRQGRLPVGDRGGRPRDRPGELAAERGRQLRRGLRVLPLPRRVRAASGVRGGLHGRLDHADRVGRRRAGAVPRARRRQPRADGRQHAAPGRADAAFGEAAGRHRHRARHRA